MKIENLKDLKTAIQACRKLGVQSIKIGDIEFHLGELPVKLAENTHKSTSYKPDPAVTAVYAPGGITDNTKLLAEITAMATDELTEDQLLNWSSAPEGVAQGEA